MEKRASGAFRSALRKELPLWRADGLISAEAEDLLISRYRLNESGLSPALLAVYVLGVMLIGGGIIAFVAWNWADMHAASKVALIISAMLAAHVGGHVLRLRGSVRLGHALTLLGTLIFGADIGLMAQIFHVSSTWYGGFGAWALGAYAAALLLESAPTATLAIVLGVVWSQGYIEDHETARIILPYVIGGLGFVAAFALKSRFNTFLSLLGGGVALLGASLHGSEGHPFVAVSLGLSAFYCALPLLAGREDRLVLGRSGTVLGLLALVVPAYFLSFHAIARELNLEQLYPFALYLPLLLLAGVIAALTTARRWWTQPTFVAALGGACAILLAARSDAPELWVTVAANVLLAGLAVASLIFSVNSLERGPFWTGSFLGGLLIVSRFFEFETGLWLKALVFIAAGVAVIVLGLSFERRLKVAGAAHA